MNTMNRRIEIINILIIRRHTTANELAQELGVSIRTIQYDIQALSPQYPIYTKPGENGGIFYKKDYKPLCQFADTYGSSCLCMNYMIGRRAYIKKFYFRVLKIWTG